MLEIEFDHMANDSIKPAYVMNPNKNSGHQSSGELPGWQYSVYCYTLMYQESDFWDPPRPYPMRLSHWLSLICIPLL